MKIFGYEVTIRKTPKPLSMNVLEEMRSWKKGAEDGWLEAGFAPDRLEIFKRLPLQNTVDFRVVVDFFNQEFIKLAREKGFL